MIVTSAMSGTLVSVYSPSASSVIAISLSTEFFAPGTCTSPRNGALCRTMIRSSPSTALSMVRVAVAPAACVASVAGRVAGPHDHSGSRR